KVRLVRWEGAVGTETVTPRGRAPRASAEGSAPVQGERWGGGPNARDKSRTDGSALGRYALPFDAAVGAAGGYLLVFLGPAAGPRDDHPCDHVARSDAECHGQFRLRQVAAAALHHAGLRRPVVLDPHDGANRVAVRACALQR